MVYEYGMGTSIRSHQVPANDWNVSEMMRQRRDEEVNEIAEEAYRGAHRLLTDHRDLLDEIAKQAARRRGRSSTTEIAAIMADHRAGEAAADDGADRAPPAVESGAGAGLTSARDEDADRPGRDAGPPPPGRA